MTTSGINSVPPAISGVTAAPRPHRIRSAAALVVIALALGLALAATLGAVVWAISTGLHAASTA